MDQIIRGEMKKVRMSPFAHKKPGAQVSLRIRSEGERFNIEIFWPGYHKFAPIDMTRQDLTGINEVLRDAVQKVAKAAGKKEQVSQALKPLAAAGQYAFGSIFKHSAATEAINAALEGYASNSEVVIQIVSEDFFLPWELLYPNPLNEPLAFKNFWGMRYQIQLYPVLFSACPGRDLPPEIEVQTLPAYGLMTDNLLPSVSAEEEPFFEKLREDKRISLAKLKALNPALQKDGLQHLQDFLKSKVHVIHIACHAEHDKRNPSLSKLRLSNRFFISLLDWQNYQLLIGNHPLVILNTCQSGNMNPLYTSYFARKLLEYGARGVVATECEIADIFAARFAQHLHRKLLAGEPLGKSLLETRKDLLQGDKKDPSGLVYSMYAAPNIRLNIKKGVD